MSAALYIHIPFCEKRCGYCDFYTLAHRQDQVPAYLEALHREIGLYGRDEQVESLTFQTLFLGGGTPSLLQPEQIAFLIRTVYSNFRFESPVEVTLETNPGTVNLSKLRNFREAGINRLSIGVQSFQANELRFLDRLHSAEEALGCFEDAVRAGFENISIDLIFALPKQTLRDWEDTLERAVALQPHHISAYNLTFEEGTPLTNLLRQGKIPSCSEDRQKALYEHTIDFLERHGYRQYEISNFAKPGFESRHNQKYWDGSPYLGLGVSSHSFLKERRFWNPRNLHQYMSLLSDNHLPVAAEERLTWENKAFENVFLGLRQRQGVNLHLFEKNMGVSIFHKYVQPLSRFFACNFNNPQLVEQLTDGSCHLKSRLLEIQDGFLKLTKQGLLLCDAVCAEFASS